MTVFTLTGISPTIFNFLTTILSAAAKATLFAAISVIYGKFIGWHLSEGFQLPVHTLGSIPLSLFSFMSNIFLNTKLSVPVMLLSVIFACCDFSSSFAILGLDFVNVIQEGSLDTVITLEFDKRNQNRLLQTAGDPQSLRTFPTDNLTFKEQSLVRSFLLAVEAIGRGESPLSHHAPLYEMERMPDLGSDIMFTAANDDLAPLSSIPLQISMICSSAEMAKLEQAIGFDYNSSSLELPKDTYFDFRLATVAAVPNCTFTSLRESGIFDMTNSGIKREAYILEHAWSSVYHSDETVQEPTKSPGLIQNGEEKRVVQLSHADRRLSKDRNNWKDGRIVSSIEGIQIGEERILFETSVLASGPSHVNLGRMASCENCYYAPGWYTYVLVNTVGSGKCPPMPSGRPLPDLQCLFVVFLVCPQFGEDSESWYGFSEAPNQVACDVFQTHIVWGANFVADAELASTVAGVIGLLKVDYTRTLNVLSHVQNAIPAALFAMSSVDLVSSNEIVVAPQVNGVYVSFMALPVILAMILFSAFACTKGTSKAIPVAPYHMLLLGHQKQNNRDIPEMTAGKDFPKNFNNRLIYSISGELKRRDDPPRHFQDRFLHHCAKKLLSRFKTEKERESWLQSRLENHDANASATSADPSLHKNFVAQLTTRKIDDRLEFLDQQERRQWLRAVVPDLDAVLPLVESAAPPTQSLAAKKGIHRANSATPLDESQTSVTSRSEIHLPGFPVDDAKPKRCSKKRKTIREASERCIVCTWEQKNGIEGGHYKKAQRGCPKCQVVVCERHWPTFSHIPGNYEVVNDATAQPEEEISGMSI